MGDKTALAVLDSADRGSRTGRVCLSICIRAEIIKITQATYEEILAIGSFIVALPAAGSRIFPAAKSHAKKNHGNLQKRQNRGLRPRQNAHLPNVNSAFVAGA
jgi:hypothetical protein